MAHGDLAYAQWQLDQYELAESNYRAALRIRTKAEGPDSPNIVIVRQTLAALLLDLERLDDAEEQLNAALELSTRTPGAEHRANAGIHDGLRLLHSARGDHEAALLEADAALALSGPHDGERGVLLTGRAQTLVALDRQPEARATLESAVDALDPAHPGHATARELLAGMADP